MHQLNHLLTAIGLMVLFASCNTEPVKMAPITGVVYNNPVGQAIGGAPDIPLTAYGAFYAINQEITDNNQTTKNGSALAWIGNDTITYQASSVLCASDSLNTQNSSWYETSQPVLNGFADSTVWNITGSSKLAGFTYTDKTPFPTVSGFNLPASISVSSPLTLSFTVDNAFDVLIFTVSGSKGVVSQNSTSNGQVTFSVAQLASATAAGDTHVGVQIMAIKSAAYGVGNKTYYFVRQAAAKKYTNTTP